LQIAFALISESSREENRCLLYVNGDSRREFSGDYADRKAPGSREDR